jgi:hypothetical protein
VHAGGAWAVVVPRLGARILGAGVGDQNALWVSPFLDACLEGRDWNAGGQRTWLAPEAGPRGLFGRSEQEWKVPPPLDPGSYRRMSADATGRRHIAIAMRTLVAADGRYVDRPPDYADAPGDVLQVYNSPQTGRATLCELECHAPAPLLAPSQGQSWPVEIWILEGPEPAILPEGLLAMPQGVPRR